MPLVSAADIASSRRRTRFRERLAIRELLRVCVVVLNWLALGRPVGPADIGLRFARGGHLRPVSIGSMWWHGHRSHGMTQHCAPN